MSPAGKIANMEPIVKLVSTIDEPSKGSKHTVNFPPSHNWVMYALSSDKPAATTPVFYRFSNINESVYTSISSYVSPKSFAAVILFDVLYLRWAAMSSTASRIPM